MCYVFGGKRHRDKLPLLQAVTSYNTTPNTYYCCDSRYIQAQ